MASFADQISQFNPYIQQLPVDAMTQVGMYKQQKYDEGVQKIQSYIDNVAGMDIYKDMDKGYLQSKLNELGSKLKTVAAGDFSNYQLVNSVGGMATQIVKDPIVQTALLSTQKVRKGQQDMEAARKAGKSSPENEDWWNMQVNDWLNDGKIGTSFSGQYEEYIDVDSKLREVAEKVKEIDMSIDNPFIRDNAGKTLYFKTDPKTGRVTSSTDPNSGGVSRIDMAMLRMKTKGKSAQKLLDNFYSSLDEREKRQLMITGNYYYKGATKETFKKDLQSTYTNNINMLKDELSDLSAELLTNSKLTNEEKLQKQKEINNIKNTLDNKNLEKELEKKLSELDAVTDIKDYKYKLYTQKYLTNLAKDLSYQSYQQEILNNPYAQMDMEKQKLQFQVNRAQQEHNEFLMRYNLDVSKDAFERQKYQDELVEKERQRILTSPRTQSGALSTNMPKPTLINLDGDIRETEKAMRILDADYKNIIFPNMSGEAKDAAIKKAISNYSQNPKLVTDNNTREWLDRRRGLEIILAQKNQLKLGALEEGKKFDQVISERLKSVGGVVDKNGRELLSAEQLLEFSRTASKFVRAAPQQQFGAARAAVPSIDERGLMSVYRGTPMEKVAEAYVKKFKGEAISNNDRIILDRATSIRSSLEGTMKKYFDEKDQAMSKYIQDRTPEYQVTYGTLNMEDKNIKQTVENLIGNKFRERSDYGALDTRDVVDFNPATVEKMQKNSKTKYILEKKYDGSGQLVMMDGTNTQIIPMDSYQFSDYFSEYAKPNPFSAVKAAIVASPNKTTNLTGAINNPAAAVNAYFTGNDIPGIRGTALSPLVRLDVEGARNNNGGRNDRFQVRMYAYTNDGWVSSVLNQQGFINEDGLREIISNIGTSTYVDVLKQNGK
jgi:hypothetical protein